MKVLIFQNRFLIGGQERQTVLHLKTLDRSRWQPVVACLHREGEHLADLAELGLRPQVFDVGRRLLRPATLWQVMRLAARIRSEGIGIVHNQDLYTNVLGTLAARLTNVPSIVTRVDLGHAIDGYRWPLLRAASRAASRVLVNALAIRDLCIRDGVDPERIVVVRNGLDLPTFDAAAARPVCAPAPDLSRPTAVIVANMHHPVKGQAELLAAMRTVVRALPAAQLVLVGDGTRRPQLEREARELGIAASCHFLGHRLDVPALLAGANCAVSASTAEGISNAVMEGMAARLAVVATAVGGTPELVRDGVNGFLVAPRDPEAMAARLRTVLADPARAARMGAEGRRIIEREFSVRQMRDAYDALYRGLARPDEDRMKQAG